ncbi:MAG: molybdenum cofactor guanylyltransferase [Verrucomicrobia bacterium]|nr:molybdenum cofactor guanylyltransferase [Verrucomicrobiota bacterium]
MPTVPELSGAVLVGGGSRRMGFPKHQIRLQGETLLGRQLRILREAGAVECWVSTGQPGGTGPGDPSDPPGVRWIHDVEPGLGPMAGLSAVLETVATPWALVLAVDLPAMTCGFLLRLIARRQDGSGVVPFLAGRYEPLAALYPRTLSPDLRSRLQRRDLRLQSMVQEAIASGHLSRYEVPPGDQALFANWNRPEDLPPDVRLTG